MAAEAAISSAVELLGDLLIQKVKFLRGVESEVEWLKDELQRMQSFLKDANKKQYEDERVRNWISDIRGLAQDAEDTIEMFLINVENASNRSLVKKCTSFAKRMLHLHTIGEEIEYIRKKLVAIKTSRETLGIKDLGEAAESSWRLQVELQRRLSPWQKDEHLVGIGDDVKKLLRDSILAEEKKGLSIAVIHGMGGIGKSTLAREIYNHCEVVAGGFECRGWVVVSSEFTPRETMKQLIMELPGSDKRKLREVEESTKDELYLLQKLKEMLHQQLQGKNYLIVLDDVWEMEHWEYLKSVFPTEQDKRSRLLVTTRNKDIAKYSQYEHEMRLLDSEKSWELLLKKAFLDSTNGKCPEELEGIGTKILEKCCGLPLAISVVGGLLVGTQTKTGWEQILNRINSHLGGAESSVSTILELSYQNLSPQLKSCFLWLACFKEDYTIPAKRLVNIWVAQGLIKQEGSSTVNEIARGYLNELINRSMLQIQDLTIDGRVKSCRLHDLLREVCLSKADELGLKIVKGKEGVSSEPSYKTRHRVVYGKNLETFSSKQNKHLRSLFLLNVSGESRCVTTPSHYWKSFQLLKILDLDGFGFEKLPHSFRFLLGLKYLRMRSNFRALQLPSWFDHLKKLEVFDVDIVLFPNVALKMERLRHFCAHNVCGLLTSIDHWKNIETIKGISLGDFLQISSRLMANSHVRELGLRIAVWDGDDVVSRARASLEKMTNLVELHLTISLTLTVNSNRITNLEVNSKIIPNLDSLTILKLSGGTFKCPAASVFPPNLSHLTLEVVFLEEDIMEELGKLPKLQYLTLTKIWGTDNVDWRRMKVLHDGFPCLKALSLQRMDYLRRIDIEHGGMPHLRQLQIHDCPLLETQNLPKHIIISSA